MEYNKQNKFCLLPFITLNTRPNGQVKPCSQVMGLTGIRKDTTVEDIMSSNNDFLDLTKDEIDVIWNSKFLKDFRLKKINNEYIEFCETCYQEDNIGIASKRTAVLDAYYEDNKHLIEEAAQNNGHMTTKPVWWEMRLSSLCNQACRMCIPQTSSKMLSEFIKFSDELPTSIRNNTRAASKFGSCLGDSKFFLDQFWDTIHDIKYLELHGGEPTIDQNIWELLNHIVDTDHAGHIHLHVHSNIHTLKQEHIDIFNKFKSGWLGISIDAFNEENEYIRYGSKWQTVEKNLKLIKGLKMQWTNWVTSSVMYYNCTTMHRLINWFLEYKEQNDLTNISWRMDPVTNPNLMRLEFVPIELRLEAISKLEGIYGDNKTSYSIEELKKALQSTEEPPIEAFEELKEYTRVLDKHRNQDYTTIFPTLKGLL